MPYRRRYKKKVYRKGKKYAYKRKYKRFRKNSPTTSKWRHNGTPDQLFAKLRYVQTVGLDSSIGAIDTQVFQSSCYDPDQTGSGHQPRYWDQLTPMYGRYQVLGMKVSYNIVNTGNTAVRIVHQWTDSTIATATAIDAYGEGKYSTTKVMGVQGKDVSYFKSYMSAKKIHGQKSVIQEDDQQAQTNANPVDMFYSNVMAQSVLSGVAYSVSIQANITYYVRFFESLQASLS